MQGVSANPLIDVARSRRKGPVWASVPADIVLPRPSVGPAELPPAPSPNTDHTRTPQESQVAKKRKAALASIKSRGKRLSRRVPDRVELSTRLDPEVYVAVVDGAEQTGFSMTRLVQDCIMGYLPQLVAFNSRYGAADPRPPRIGDRSAVRVGKERRMRAVQDLTASIPEYRNPEMPAPERFNDELVDQ
jgi:hypothetical protein